MGLTNLPIQHWVGLTSLPFEGGGVNKPSFGGRWDESAFLHCREWGNKVFLPAEVEIGDFYIVHYKWENSYNRFSQMGKGTNPLYSNVQVDKSSLHK